MHASVSPLRAAVIVAVLIAAGALALGCGSAGTLAPSPPTTILPSRSVSPSPSGSATTFAPSPTPTSTVSPGRHIADATIEANILKKIGQDPSLLHLKIRVIVHKGVVSMFGTVATTGQRHAAENWAITEPGVKKVVSYIVVNPDEGGGGGTGPY